MCKYCNVNEEPTGDFYGSNTILFIKDGSFRVDVTLDRYADIDTKNNKFENKIRIEESLLFGDSYYDVKDKSIREDVEAR